MSGATVAIVRRELRAIRPLVLAATALALVGVLGLGLTTVPSLRWSLADTAQTRTAFGGGSFVLGLALAWRQVEEEHRADTWTGYWLLPVARRTLVLVKLGMGALAVLVAAALPALILVLFILLVPARGGPFDRRAFLLVGSSFVTGLLALAAGWIASVRRDARLVGTRLLPIGSAAVLAIVAGVRDSGPWLLAAVAGAALVFVATAMRTAMRPAATRDLLASSGIAVTFIPTLVIAGAVATSVVDSVAARNTVQRVQQYNGLARDGAPVRVRSGATVDALTPLTDAPLASSDEAALTMSPLDRVHYTRSWHSQYSGSAEAFYDPEARVFDLYASRGPQEGERTHCIGATGMSASECDPFAGDLLVVLQMRSQTNVIVTTKAVYRLARDTGEISVLLEGNIAGAHELVDERAAAALWIDGGVIVLGNQGERHAACSGPDTASASMVLVGLTKDDSVALRTIDDRHDRAHLCSASGGIVRSFDFEPEPKFPGPSFVKQALPFIVGPIAALVAWCVVVVARRRRATPRTTAQTVVVA